MQSGKNTDTDKNKLNLYGTVGNCYNKFHGLNRSIGKQKQFVFHVQKYMGHGEGHMSLLLLLVLAQFLSA